MRRAHHGLPGKTFTRPDGVVNANICRDSGLLATAGCTRANRAYSEMFVRGTVPSNYCEVHRAIADQRPTITLNGSSNITLNVGDVYTELRSNSNRRI